MTKIDITKIENYSSLNPEEKVALLESYEFETFAPNNSEIEKLKAAVSKANSEAADWKKKHNALLSEDEQKKLEREAKEAENAALLESLKKENAITKGTAKFLGLGYDEKLAAETALALAEGDMDKVFANQQIHIENIKKTLSAEALIDNTKPPAGTGSQTNNNDYPKLIAEAQAISDFGTAAMLIRQQQEATMQK